MTPAGIPTLERKPDIPRGPYAPGGDGGQRPERGGNGSAAAPVPAASIAVWLLVGAITVLFAAFTSTYLVRRAEADWQSVPLPAVLWVNSAVLIISSGTMEWARRGARAERADHLRAGLVATTALGVAFLAGQIVAWRQLVAEGLFLASNPHSAFFYMLTGAHGLHLVAGVIALFYAVTKTRRLTPLQARGVVDPTAVYWHFLDGLWLYLFILLFWP